MKKITIPLLLTLACIPASNAQNFRAVALKESMFTMMPLFKTAQEVERTGITLKQNQRKRWNNTVKQIEEIYKKLVQLNDQNNNVIKKMAQHTATIKATREQIEAQAPQPYKDALTKIKSLQQEIKKLRQQIKMQRKLRQQIRQTEEFKQAIGSDLRNKIQSSRKERNQLRQSVQTKLRKLKNQYRNKKKKLKRIFRNAKQKRSQKAIEADDIFATPHHEGMGGDSMGEHAAS